LGELNDDEEKRVRFLTTFWPFLKATSAFTRTPASALVDTKPASALGKGRLEEPENVLAEHFKP